MMKRLGIVLCVMLLVAGSASAALLTHLEFEGNTTDTTGNIIYTGTPGAYVAGPAGFGQAMEFQKAFGNVVYAEGVGAQMSTVSTEITVSMWAYGSQLLPSTGDPTILFSANVTKIYSGPLSM